MSRFAFKMFLKPGFEAEYEKRHAAIWPELVKLFGYQECSGEGNSQDTSNGIDPITQKWWDMMADIMEVHPEDNSPITIPLKEVFHLD